MQQIPVSEGLNCDTCKPSPVQHFHQKHEEGVISESSWHKTLALFAFFCSSKNDFVQTFSAIGTIGILYGFANNVK